MSRAFWDPERVKRRSTILNAIAHSSSAKDVLGRLEKPITLGALYRWIRRNRITLDLWNRDDPKPPWLEQYLRKLATRASSRTYRRRLKLYQAGATDAQVAKRERITPDAARLWRIGHLALRRSRKLSEAESRRREDVVFAHRNATDGERARLLGMNIRTFNKWKNTYNWHEARAIVPGAHRTVNLLPEHQHARLRRLVKRKRERD